VGEVQGDKVSLGDQVAVVTGGGRGIGRGIVAELAAAGLSVVINYRSDSKAAFECLQEAEARGARRALAIQADVADLAQGRRLLEATLDQFGRVDLWVNNAGIAPKARVDMLETSPESWDDVLATNLRGPFFLSQAVAVAMLRLQQSAVITSPRIVFITSISSTFASTNRAEYCVSKAALSMVAQLFAVRLAGQGILVYEIRPGLIDTDMTRLVHDSYTERIAQGISPIRRWGTPRDVGRAVAGLSQGLFPFSTGEVINVDGGLNLRIL
jgi:3-oxoacyl-[acyl-carrier protein] reductase